MGPAQWEKYPTATRTNTGKILQGRFSVAGVQSIINTKINMKCFVSS